MRATPERPAFYALGTGRLGDLVALLHPPYTAWHLSYFALGAAVAPRVHADRLLWGLAAFALAVGVAAHALDELHDRPLGTALPDGALAWMAAVSLLGALAIGVAGTVVVTPWLAPLVVVGVLFVVAYNLELAGGRVHGDAWFALGWGDRRGAPDGGGVPCAERRAATPEHAGARAASPHQIGARRSHAPGREDRGAVARGHARPARRGLAGAVGGCGDRCLRGRRRAALGAAQVAPKPVARQRRDPLQGPRLLE